MEFLIFIFNMIIVISVVVAVFSYMGSYKDSKKSTSKLIEEMTLNSSHSERVEKEYTSQEELDALNIEYSLAAREAVQTKNIIGLIAVNTLSSDGTSSSMVTIKDITINVPSSLPVSVFSNSERLTKMTGGSNHAKVALVDKKFYLLSLGDFSLTQEIRSEQFERYAQMPIKEGYKERVERKPLEIKNERDGTDYEKAYFDSIKAGIPYALLMMLSFIIAPFFMDKEATAVVWFCIYISILICGFGLWFKSLKKSESTVKIKKMYGQFDEVVSQGNRKFVQVYDSANSDLNSDSKLAFRLPTIWDESYKIPLHKKTTFEVLSGTMDLVSIERYKPLNHPHNMKPKQKYIGWMIATLLVLAFNIFFYTNVHQAQLALNMSNTSPDVKKINDANDWGSIDQVGQRIETEGFYKQCLSHKPSATAKESRTTFCNEFNVLESSPEMNLMEAAQPILDTMKRTDSDVSFPVISSSIYSELNRKVNLMNMFGIYGDKQQLVPRNNLLQYNNYSLHKWAKWLNDNELNDESLQDLLITLWKEEDVMTCSDGCWNDMLSFKKESQRDDQSSFENRETLKPLLDIKAKYLAEQAGSIVSLWTDTFFTDERNDKADIRVRLVRFNNYHEHWSNLNHEIQVARIESAIDYVQLFSDTSQELVNSSQGNIDYGVVSDIESDGEGRVLVIDTMMNEMSYEMNLVKMFLILMSLIGILLLVMHSKRLVKKTNTVIIAD